MKIFKILPIIFLFFGCKQRLDDEDNAIVCGYVYQKAIPVDSVISGYVRDTLGNIIDTLWKYIKWKFENPVESVRVWVESDVNSDNPYIGPDLDGYTDAQGYFAIPVFLGASLKQGGGYDYKYYADVKVFWVYGSYSYDYGGGITLTRGDTFELFPTAIIWGEE